MWQLLIVEDDRRMREFLCEGVRRCGELSLVRALNSRASALQY